MSHIKVITPPDKLFNNNLKFLLIYPTELLKSQFQDQILNFEENFDVYIYDIDENEEGMEYEHDIDWLLTMANICNIVILDVDNCPSIIRDLASYIIANNNTFWLTNSGSNVYNKLSTNRVFTLDFLQQTIGDQLEQKKEL
jgi:hypothetical protein